MKQLQKPEKRTSWEEAVHNGWGAWKMTNSVETKQKMFFTSEHKTNFGIIPQKCEILSSLLLITDRESISLLP